MDRKFNSLFTLGYGTIALCVALYGLVRFGQWVYQVVLKARPFNLMEISGFLIIILFAAVLGIVLVKVGLEYRKSS